jgi:hypothetical protein
MRKILVAAALVGGMAYLGSSTAQEFDRELFQKMMKAGQVMRDHPVAVVNNPGVQKELKMDEEQVKAVQEKVTTAGLSFGFGGGRGGFGRGKGKGGGGGGDFKERMAKMMEKMQALKDVPDDKFEEKVLETFKEELEAPTKEIEKILKPEQQARLKQIARQQGGPAAYLKPDNVKDLGLAEDQRTKLRTIATELERDVNELRRGGGGGKGGFGPVPPETREKIDNLTKEATEKAANVLTAEQKSKWKELTGEPYTVTVQRTRPKRDD